MTITERTPEAGLREAVGVFHSAAELETAIDSLMENGFDRAEISLLANDRAVEEKLGHRYRSVKELEDDDKVPRTAYVSAESVGAAEGALVGSLLYVGASAAAGAVVASGGTAAGALVAAAMAGGAGGLIGSVLADLVGRHHAARLTRQLDRGGLLLWVRTWDSGDEARATKILTECGAEDVHIHTLPA